MQVRLANESRCSQGPPRSLLSFPDTPWHRSLLPQSVNPVVVDALSVDRYACPSQSCLHHDSFRRVRSERRAAGMCVSVDRPAPTTLCKLTAVRCSIRRTQNSRSRRCHDVWLMPGSIWRRRDSTGTHSTLRLTESGTVSVDCARFKSPLAHSVSPSQKTIHGRLWAQLDCLPSVSSAA